ncbi:hypothetical protein [Cryobacterium sp. Y50]|uniref:hypothetical protein n=1 Tax=Cryobacterium sp. Y50 TaxID=2048286 RepID=UPI0011B0CD90|nr:hypothetical protein [Cryobacterium sp. Y50]
MRYVSTTMASAIRRQRTREQQPTASTRNNHSRLLAVSRPVGYEESCHYDIGTSPCHVPHTRLHNERLDGDVPGALDRAVDRGPGHAEEFSDLRGGAFASPVDLDAVLLLRLE